MCTDKTQHDKFKDAAKELGCDENEARFEDTVKKVAKLKRELKENKNDG